MQIEGWIHELNKVVEREELGAHAGLVPEEIVFLGVRVSRVDRLRLG